MPKAYFDPQAIADPKLIAVLASPVRQEIIDSLFSLGGEATIADLAEHVGRYADGLYYHLRVLDEVGLIQRIDNQRGSQRIYRLAGEGRLPLRLKYQLDPPGNAASLLDYAHGLTAVARRDFEQAIERSNVGVSGDHRELWAARNKGWVGPAELAEVNHLLRRLCDLVSQTRTEERDKLITLTFVLTPAGEQPKRRGANLSRNACS